MLLPSGADIADVRARAHATGVTTELVEGGFLTHDPWESAVGFLATDSPVSLPKGA